MVRGTRGRIIRLLRRGARTAKELAAELGVTDTAVRMHLSKLAIEGWVQRAGKRPTRRRPEHLYRLAPDAERFFPRAYGPLLDQLMEVLGERLDDEGLRAALDEVALRLAAQLAPKARGDLAERAGRAAEIVETLGGLAEVESSDEALCIRGWRCPFAEVSPWHPELCHLVEVLLSEATGLSLHEHCDRDPEVPRCAFSTEPATNATSPSAVRAS